MTRLETFIGELGSRKSEGMAAMPALIGTLRDLYEAEHIVYHAVNRAGEPYAFETYDPSWRPHYLKEGYVHVDPVVQGSFQRFHPLDWRELDWTAPKRRRFAAEAHDAGVGTQGLTIPIRGPFGQFGGLTINANAPDGEWERFKSHVLQDMLLISHYVHQVADAADASAAPVMERELSPREREALTRLAQGLSRGQAADAMKISEHTLRVYIETARHKLNALNTVHAVALGVSRGLVTL